MTIRAQTETAGHRQKPPVSREKACYMQNPDVIERRIGDSLFLVDPNSDTIFHLNRLGSGLWQLLSEPVRIQDAARTVQEAFPEIDGDKIYTDVLKVFAKLMKAHLLLEV